jgi:hypothetical protein
MAESADHPTPIKDLDDLLRYLTEELGYEKYDALWEMEQKYLDGQLRLEKQDLIRDDEPYGDWIAINALYGHIELNRRGRVRVVPLTPLWREASYRIAEGCDARAIWPRRPPASQAAPAQQPEVGLDPFRTGAAGRPTAAHIVLDEAKRRIVEKEVTPTSGGLTAFSKKLADWWDVKRKASEPHGPEMKAGSIANVVRDEWNKALAARN